MIGAVLNVTLYTMEGEGVDRYKVTCVHEGKLVEITEQYELCAAETEDGRQGWALFLRLAPVEHYQGPVRKDEDPPGTVVAEDSSAAPV